MTIRRSLLAVVLALAALTSSLPAEASARAARVSDQAALIKRVNEVRGAYGLRALRAALPLHRGALAHSRRLLAAGSLWHASLEPVSARYGRAGEVLAMHPGDRAQVGRTVSAWLNSPPHRAVLLSPVFRHVGAGRSSGRFGDAEATVWVLRAG